MGLGCRDKGGAWVSYGTPGVPDGYFAWRGMGGSVGFQWRAYEDTGGAHGLPHHMSRGVARRCSRGVMGVSMESLWGRGVMGRALPWEWGPPYGGCVGCGVGRLMGVPTGQLCGGSIWSRLIRGSL